MSEISIYVLKVSVVCSLLTLTYYFVFRHLTFHAVNRAILLLIIALSLVLPVIDFGQSVIQYDLFKGASLEPPVTVETSDGKGPLEGSKNNIWLLIDSIYLLGVLASLTLLVLNAIKLFQSLYSSNKVQSKYPIWLSDADVVFSCFNRIYVPKNYLIRNNDPVIQHEYAHVKLHHSYDLLLMEFFIAFTWFNPFVYLFRKLIRSIHEFQADSYVLSGEVKKSEYLSLMLESIADEGQFSLVNSFKRSTTKNRIKMITKNNSSIAQSAKYLVLVPVLMVISFAFAEIIGSKPAIFPIKEGLYEKISAPYGKTVKDPFSSKMKEHGGIDIVAKMGTPVMATGSGKVIKAGPEGDWGNMVIIDHGQGYQSWYAHLKDINIKVEQTIHSGEIIGHVGSTGKSTGPHLHYEVRKDGQRQNPEDYFTVK